MPADLLLTYNSGHRHGSIRRLLGPIRTFHKDIQSGARAVGRRGRDFRHNRIPALESLEFCVIIATARHQSSYKRTRTVYRLHINLTVMLSRPFAGFGDGGSSAECKNEYAIYFLRMFRCTNHSSDSQRRGDRSLPSEPGQCCTRVRPPKTADLDSSPQRVNIIELCLPGPQQLQFCRYRKAPRYSHDVVNESV